MRILYRIDTVSRKRWMYPELAAGGRVLKARAASIRVQDCVCVATLFLIIAGRVWRSSRRLRWTFLLLGWYQFAYIPRQGSSCGKPSTVPPLLSSSNRGYYEYGRTGLRTISIINHFLAVFEQTTSLSMGTVVAARKAADKTMFFFAFDLSF